MQKQTNEIMKKLCCFLNVDFKSQNLSNTCLPACIFCAFYLNMVLIDIVGGEGRNLYRLYVTHHKTLNDGCLTSKEDVRFRNMNPRYNNFST
jgi:hypothetical protein